MAKTNNIIEINGKRYDAVTGVAIITPARQSVDPAAAKKHSRTTKIVVAHAPQTAHTLMRQSVKKPSAGLKSQLRAQGLAEAKPVGALAELKLSKSVHRLDHHKLNSAKQINKSHLIKHFSDVKADFQSAPVAAVPPPVKHLPAKQPVASRNNPSSHVKTTADLLERALQSAPTHQQPPVKKPRQRSRAKLSLAAGMLVIIALAAFGRQGLTTIKLHAASAEAGFSASLPDYHPAGYSVGRINYSNGEVAAQFNNTSGNSGYSLTQKRSDWDNQALINEFVIGIDPSYQTVNSNGLSIEVYNQHNATWVNGGVWYILQGNENLTTAQLVRLATSL